MGSFFNSIIRYTQLPMAIQSKKESIQVSADADDLVSLTVTIGNAQIGGNLIKEKDKVVAKGEIANLALGTGAELKGRSFNITTNILDVNEQSNGVVATYFFQKKQSTVFTLHAKVENDGDIFSFEIELKFE